MSELGALHQDEREVSSSPASNQSTDMASETVHVPAGSTLPRADSAKRLQRLSRLPPRQGPASEELPSTVPPPILLQGQELEVKVETVLVDPIQSTKPVFSLFLTPDQRKQKQLQGADDISKGRRGRKPKTKTGVTQLSPAPMPAPTSSTPTDLKTIVDPNISKTGETHRFFQEVKASKLLSAESATGKGAEDESSWRRKRWHGVTPQSSRLPYQHEHFHGTETIDTINGVVARICGIDAYSALSKTSAAALDSLQAFSKSRPRSTKMAHLKRDSGDLWYSLRSTPDLGITAPEVKLKYAGGDSLTHRRSPKTSKESVTGGASSISAGETSPMNRSSTFREWTEKPLGLSKPSAQDRDVLSRHPDPAEFESCKRVAPDQPLWNQAWATTLLSTPSTNTAAYDAHGSTTATRATTLSAMESPPELRVGELWTEKYRPTQGAEVLGNRANTEYLTQWLRGLEVTGWTLNPEEQAASTAVATSVVVAGVRKRRPRKRARRKDLADLDDFIVYDDEADDFEDPYGSGGYASEDDNHGLFDVTKPISSLAQFAKSELAVKEKDPIVGELGASRVLPKQFDIKSNTILLSGPIGSGKTAAVYACAEESGYEVFEVSPGTRRTGKDLLGLVGEMAENHHVHIVAGGRTAGSEDSDPAFSSGTPAQGSTPVAAPVPAKSTIQSFFQQQQKKQVSEDIVAEDSEMPDATEIDIEDDSTDDGKDYSTAAFTKAHNGTPALDTQLSPTPSTQYSSRSSSPSKSAMDEDAKNEAVNDDSLAFHEDTLSDLYSLLATTNPRQSLILLEEVDILFEDDKGFWSSVMTLLAKSKRPVVMTCNDTSKIPPTTLRFQEHLEFSRPGLPELHHYLSAICKIEGFICSSEYITALIRQHGRHDVRKCLMQLQYDAGLARKRRLFPFSTPTRIEARSRSPIEVAPGPSQSVAPVVETPPVPSTTPASPSRRKPQRLLRISVRGIVPATAPTSSSQPSSPTPVVNPDASALPMAKVVPVVHSVRLAADLELEQLEAQGRYAEGMSLSDASLRMTAARVFQCYEIDQYAASKDDVVVQQHSSIWKRSSGADHLYLDQELAGLFEFGLESLQPLLRPSSSIEDSHVILFEDSIKREDPEMALSEHFAPLSDNMSRTLLRMQPALEQILPIQVLRFQLRSAFSLYAPVLRTMLRAQEMNTVVPLGKRTMRSGGHLRRHLQMLSDQEATSLLSTTLEGHHY